MSKIKELVRIILGSGAIGFAGATVTSGATVLVTHACNVSIFIAAFVGFTVAFMSLSLLYAVNRKMWDTMLSSDIPFIKMLPNVKAFYDMVMYVTKYSE